MRALVFRTEPGALDYLGLALVGLSCGFVLSVVVMLRPSSAQESGFVCKGAAAVCAQP